ncbi:helix-turn-helix domain-containing protein [Actinomadura luzonensis]|uniref:helix-turn-helix domain-containing protein n=1 Tax=Actinomadura luzonensis TaxID=2805427 RepID=UPI002E1E6012
MVVRGVRTVRRRVVEQRYQAVLQVLSGASLTEVARRFGVSRQAAHRWSSRSRRSRPGSPLGTCGN